MTNFFSLAAFKILSLSLTFGILMMMYLGVGLFASIIIGTLCTSWTCVSVSFNKLGKLSFTIFPDRFPIFCSVSSSSGSPMREMLDLLKLSQRLLYYPLFLDSFFFLLFYMVVFCFLIFQIIDLILGFIHSTVVSL